MSIMVLANTQHFVNAGKEAARNETHTCAGTDPIVIGTIGINPESPALPAIVAAWDNGYMAERANMLINSSNSENS